MRYANAYGLAIAPAIHALSTATRPLVWLLTTISNAVLSLFGDRTTFSESRISPAELRLIVNEAGGERSIHPAAGEIAARALEFPELTASDVMVPRARVVGIPRSLPTHRICRGS